MKEDSEQSETTAITLMETKAVLLELLNPDSVVLAGWKQRKTSEWKTVEVKRTWEVKNETRSIMLMMMGKIIKCWIETWKTWLEGSTTAPNIFIDKVITASMGESKSNEEVAITFSNPMLQAVYIVIEIRITISSVILVKFSWIASYSDNTTLIIKL
jgi:hypothetical protein